MLPTPSTSHIDVNRVYDPAEDSFLLLDTFSSPAESEFLQQRLGMKRTNQGLASVPTISPLVVEVGTGSGVVVSFITAHAKTIFGRNDIMIVGTDINPFACQATQETVAKACRNGSKPLVQGAVSAVFMNSLNMDLANALRPGTIDVLIFNPPYVPTPDVPQMPGAEMEDEGGVSSMDFDTNSHMLALSYAGGRDGMETTNRLVAQLPLLLSADTGTAYILLCHQNRPQEVMQSIRNWGTQWSVEVAGQSNKTSGWEKLCVIRIWRT